MTEASRREQIQRALAAHKEDPEAERREFSLSRGSVTLPVVRLPLSVPVLNTKSFRIAPALLDHPEAELVAADPDSDAAQKVVADLVRSGHRNAADLRRSLQEQGQAEPGVITRSGVLINANTRCILMRDLLRDGLLPYDSIKVAVLPDDVTPSELYDLEAVLQKQQDLKDPYDLVSELMMFQTLHAEGGMTEQQIAARQRTTVPYVVQGFNILRLMERARHLTEPPLPIKTFGGAKGQRENWKSLLSSVDAADATGHKEAGDEILRSYLALHLLESDGVHALRGVTPEWIEDHLLDALADSGDLGTKIAETITTSVSASAPEPSAATDDSADDGLDLLDFGSDNAQPSTGSHAKALLDLALAATNAGSLGNVELGDGTKVSSGDLINALAASSTSVLKDQENRLSAGKRIADPATLLSKAHSTVVKANKALARVIEVPDFADVAGEVESLLDDLTAQVTEARTVLRRASKP